MWLVYEELRKMWTREIMGTEVIYLVECFILYSLIGWVVESLYMSFCNRRWTNRGFTFGPFCPIYGFGGVVGYILMHPLSSHLVCLYLVGAALATTFEYLVGILMQKVLHEVWWDYHQKPFNYKGIICLESTLAWGFYAIIIVRFLNGCMMNLVSRVPFTIARRLCWLVILIYFVDFSYHLLAALGYDLDEKKEKAKDIYRNFREKFI
jgi:uncharacterized membrane protein